MKFKPLASWEDGLRLALLILADTLCILFTYFFVSLVFESIPQASGVLFDPLHWTTILAITLLSLLVFGLGGMYSSLWEYSGSREMLQIAAVTLASTLSAFVVSVLINNRMRYTMYVFAWLILFLLCGAVRFALHIAPRLLRRRGATRRGSSVMGQSERRVLIVGAGFMGSIVIARMQDDRLHLGRPIACIDDDPSKWGKRIHGIRVEGGRDQLARVCRDALIDDIVVAIPTLGGESRRSLLELCMSTGCQVKTTQDFNDLLLNGDTPLILREIRLEDLLARKEIHLDNDAIAAYIKDQNVLVTGGGGSIGSELCRQIALYEPKRIILYDIYENAVFDLKNELLELYRGKIDIAIEIGSIRDEDRLDRVFSRYRPSVVFHAAAHKHVPLMEDCPGEALKNNVFGTLNVAQAADRYKAKRFVMISTDKAVNASSAMGASKRLAESLVQGLFKKSETRFAVVRFGNVLGSNGSVVLTFRRQIAAGGPVTVTHPDIVRFFMTIPEAARLVLQAASMARGGEIYILNMGEPVKILDLAENLIRLSGYVPYQDIPITFTGLRPGEKLYEELQLSEEETLKTDNRDIFVCSSIQHEPERLWQMLEELRPYCNANAAEVKKALVKALPSYRAQIKKWDGEENPDQAYELRSAQHEQDQKRASEEVQTALERKQDTEQQDPDSNLSQMNR